MKYEPSEEYLFEASVLTDGLNAKDVEEILKKSVMDLISSKQANQAFLTNETHERKARTFKLFTVLEELQNLKFGKIVDIRRIPEEWKEELKKEMEEKDELDGKRLLSLDDCIIVCIEKENKVTAVVINRKGIYSLSKNAPQ